MKSSGPPVFSQGSAATAPLRQHHLHPKVASLRHLLRPVEGLEMA